MFLHNKFQSEEKRRRVASLRIILYSYMLINSSDIILKLFIMINAMYVRQTKYVRDAACFNTWIVR